MLACRKVGRRDAHGAWMQNGEESVNFVHIRIEAALNKKQFQVTVNGTGLCGTRWRCDQPEDAIQRQSPGVDCGRTGEILAERPVDV